MRFDVEVILGCEFPTAVVTCELYGWSTRYDPGLGSYAVLSGSWHHYRKKCPFAKQPELDTQPHPTEE